MKRVMQTVVMAAVLMGLAAPAMAQMPAPAQPAAGSGAPAVNMGYLGVTSGLGIVQNVGAIAGAEGGIHLTGNLDVVAEGGWAADLVTRRIAGLTAPVVNYLTSTQGKTATGEVKAPGLYGLAGLRWVAPTSGSLRPYVLGQVGVARIEYQPTFTLGGTDVTSTVSTYGVTLGDDLAGTVTKVAFGGGVGVLYLKGQWYADAGYRFVSIGTETQRTPFSRLHLGFGVRF